METDGSTTAEIQGLHFDGGSINITHKPYAGGKEVAMTGCTIHSATVATCKSTGEGTGKDHIFIVGIREETQSKILYGIRNKVLKKNYTKPTIASAGINPANFATTRVETITIPGTNFGPIDYFETLKVWYYINTNKRYEMDNCSVSTKHAYNDSTPCPIVC